MNIYNNLKDDVKKYVLQRVMMINSLIIVNLYSIIVLALDFKTWWLIPIICINTILIVNCMNDIWYFIETNDNNFCNHPCIFVIDVVSFLCYIVLPIQYFISQYHHYILYEFIVFILYAIVCYGILIIGILYIIYIAMGQCFVKCRERIQRTQTSIDERQILIV
ncbi:MAG TPA: hypothetical protein VLG50_05625 [Candidatus Saccharimonadales bacterium]|nr:hypothetical protein [Candidatus Saccharimonadales bacterium]